MAGPVVEIRFDENSRNKTVLRDELLPDNRIEHAVWPQYRLTGYVTHTTPAYLPNDCISTRAFIMEKKALTARLVKADLAKLAQLHGLEFDARFGSRETITRDFLAHHCEICVTGRVLLEPFKANVAVPAEGTDALLLDLPQYSKKWTARDLRDFIPDVAKPHFKKGAEIVSVWKSRNRKDYEAMDHGRFLANVPLAVLSQKLRKEGLITLGKLHCINLPTRWKIDAMQQQLITHICDPMCTAIHIEFEARGGQDRPRETPSEQGDEPENRSANRCSNGSPTVDLWPGEYVQQSSEWPPTPLTTAQKRSMMAGFTAEFTSENVEESGCAICGQLHLRKDLADLQKTKLSLVPLIEDDVAFREGETNAPRQDIKHPIVDPRLHLICSNCERCLKRGVRPKMALANGLWLGEVPEVMKKLTYVERLLVARVRHNRCVIRVNNGHSRMSANVIAFANPTGKIYKRLPPTRREIEDVIAFIFVGSQPPTEVDLKRTPMLVRRLCVLEALEWLKRNHSDYGDLEVDFDALNTFPAEGVPVPCVVRTPESDDTNLLATEMSLHESELADGVDSGDCPIKVHFLTAEHYGNMTAQQRRAAAVRHLVQGGSLLAVGHNENPESMYDNPQLYPQMFPWLFPYGCGGVGQKRHKDLISEKVHLKWLLNYHDKRFQQDPHFIVVVYNHQQIKKSVTNSFILTHRNNFETIARKIQAINPGALEDIADRLESGERVVPQNEEERKCFALFDQINHVSGTVGGSIGSKKKMRNELWSLLAFKGAPSWFVTFSPVDNKHPLCFYWSGTDEKFRPELPVSASQRLRTISQNPVACAKFFDFMVRMFIKHVLGWREDHEGRYGETDAFYGTVEQQGRLTLHMHMLIWIAGAFSPSEIRERLLDKSSEFSRNLIAYLEGCFQGEFLTGPMASVASKFEHAASDPATKLPLAPPEVLCGSVDCACSNCQAVTQWDKHFQDDVDHLILKSNVHQCYVKKDSGTANGKSHATAKGCLNKDGVCTARFPRPTFPTTVIEDDGHITMKKGEGQINTITPEVTYLVRSNSDVGTLLSGTAIKAIIGYVTDYVTKSSLKTYQVFSSAYDIFTTRNTFISRDTDNEEAARKTVLKVVNSLTSKLEMGAPMAALYVMELPDRYSSHSFAPFYWKVFVNHINEESKQLGERTIGTMEGDEEDEYYDGESGNCDERASEERVRIALSGGKYISISSVDDYRYRPREFERYSLYEWIQCATRKRCTHDSPEDVISEDETLVDEEKPIYCRYEDGHPLQDTHLVSCDPLRRGYIAPDWIGPIMPRRDQGDREEYCMTMLTFFKPWRNASDLKQVGQAWASAFRSHHFSAFHSKIMDNLNLRYECYDARDDYAAQMKKLSVPGIGEVDAAEHADAGDDYGIDDAATQALMDKDSLSRKRNELALKLTLESAGWMPEEQDEPGDRADEEVEEDHVAYTNPSSNWNLPGYKTSEWKSLLEEERKRRQNVTSLPGGDAYDFDGYDRRPKIRNDAYVVPGSYLSKDFKPETEEDRCIVSEIAKEFTLNYEQEKAFKIVAHHAISGTPEQLKMYIAGVGGTGKSQVIKALIRLFIRRGEQHRLIVLAPTGNAASLIDGMTYHSYLHIYPGDHTDSAEIKAIEEVKGKIGFVDYIFIDEVSMLSCQDLYRIDKRLASGRPDTDGPFGGISLIFAGDFAQLPPVTGSSLYSEHVSLTQSARDSGSDVNASSGKRTWHQITTVVMLKQNMRQSQNSAEDSKFRTALTNLRYYACTDEDIAWLRSRIPARNPNIDLNAPELRLASIISPLNVDKDSINDVYSARFAKEHNVKIHTFRCFDKLSTARPRSHRGRRRAFLRLDSLTRPWRMALWNQQPHLTTKQVPSTLKLCVGMPVCIRYNVATEVCVTNGQEATVEGWMSKPVPGWRNQRMLEVLFVKLTNPTKSVQLAGLPENVVPLTRRPHSVTTIVGNKVLPLTRSQVPILPSFAMTDFTSQGKTRAINVMEFTKCRSFQAIYTCLSRGTSAEGTVILQDFEVSDVRGKLGKGLRMEYKALTILDEITDLRYNGKLAPDVVRDTRGQTIQRFKESMNREDEEDRDYSPVYYDGEEEANREVDGGVREGSPSTSEPVIARTSPSNTNKRSRQNNSGPPEKRRKVAPHLVVSGLSWDSVNHSCAYDSCMMILFNMWKNDRERTVETLCEYGQWTAMLACGFEEVVGGRMTLNGLRDCLRKGLTILDPDSFPSGSQGCDIRALLGTILNFNLSTPRIWSRCSGCLREDHQLSLEPVRRIVGLGDRETHTSGLYGRASPQGTCSVCDCQIFLDNRWENLMTVVNEVPLESVDVVLSFETAEYELRAVTYHNGNHFISRWIDNEGGVYLDDSMEPGEMAVKETGSVGEMNMAFAKGGAYEACVLWYMRR